MICINYEIYMELKRTMRYQKFAEGRGLVRIADKKQNRVPW